MLSLKIIVENCRIWEGFKAVTLILPLALYVASGTGNGLFHGHQSFVSHSAEEENDPCHRAIYHVEKDSACKHESHFSKNEKCCDLHLLSRHADQIVVRSSLTQFVDSNSVIKTVLTFPHMEEVFLHHPSRAPPLI